MKEEKMKTYINVKEFLFYLNKYIGSVLLTGSTLEEDRGILFCAVTRLIPPFPIPPKTNKTRNDNKKKIKRKLAITNNPLPCPYKE